MMEDIRSPRYEYLFLIEKDGKKENKIIYTEDYNVKAEIEKLVNNGYVVLNASRIE